MLCVVCCVLCVVCCVLCVVCCALCVACCALCVVCCVLCVVCCVCVRARVRACARACARVGGGGGGQRAELADAQVRADEFMKLSKRHLNLVRPVTSAARETNYVRTLFDRLEAEGPPIAIVGAWHHHSPQRECALREERGRVRERRR